MRVAGVSSVGVVTLGNGLFVVFLAWSCASVMAVQEFGVAEVSRKEADKVNAD